MIDLKKYHKEDMTQFGQAGVLQKIFEEIGTTNKYFVEFGSDGSPTGGGNSAFLRVRHGFTGLLMDGSNHPNAMYELKKEFIWSKNINDLFIKYNIPLEFDFLSIDIDNNDWYVWKALDSKYQPRVVSIEAGSDFPKNADTIRPELNHMVCPQPAIGASALAIYNLGRYKGYDYVAHCGVDAIFIRSDILHPFIKNDFDYIYDGPINRPIVNPEGYNKSTDLLGI